MKTYTKEEVDTLLNLLEDKGMQVLTDDPEGGEEGQLVVYTGIWHWKNGEYHDTEEVYGK